MSNLRQHWEHLYQRQRAMQQQWQRTREAWDDAGSQRFERQYWHELDQSMNATLKALDQLAQIVDQAQRNVR